MNSEIDIGILRNGKRRDKTTGNTRSADMENSRKNIPNQSETNAVTEKSAKVLKLGETVCFKPKTKQEIDVTRNDLRSSFDPVKMKIKSLRFARDSGDAFVQCTSNESACVLLKEAKRTLSEKYVITIRKPNKPKIRIVGYEAEENDNDGERFLNKLIRQNNLPANAEIKVIKTFKNKNWKYSADIAIIEVDPETFEILLRKEKVNIGWDRCKVYETVSILRCYKCWSYGHKSAECNEPICCPHCAGCHESKNCNVDILQCINCCRRNRQMNLSDKDKLDICHSALSFDCPIYKNKSKNAKQFIDYSK